MSIAERLGGFIMVNISRRNVLISTAFAGMTGLSGTASAAAAPCSAAMPKKWNYEADVVIIGAGAVGLPAAIGARDAGLSVLVVDANYDIGGHAITSGGNVPLGGGTSFQKKYGIKDSPELVFKDLTDWSIVESGGMPDYRYNDRAVQHALAFNMAPAFEFLLANGVPFVDQAPDNSGAHAVGLSARREHHTLWFKGQSAESPAGAGGTLLMRSLEASARKKGVQFLLNYHMDELYREAEGDRRVVGLKAHYSPKVNPETGKPLSSFKSEGNISETSETIVVHAKKALVIATGGNAGNVEFRRIFDPRLTAEYANAAEEYSPQDASGELAAMAIGASLWGTANQAMDRNGSLRKRPLVGVRTNYIRWTPKSSLYPLIKHSGLNIRDWQDAIIVNQVGKRFYNELESGYPNGSHEGFFKDGKPYVHGDWRNTTRKPFRPRNYIDAALALNEGSAEPDFSAGPQWAIFDAKALERENITLTPGICDPELFFEADTLEALAAKINTSPWQKWKMDGKVLAESVARYNTFVKAGKDEDFDKPAPQYAIETGPFYAAWATFAVHDSYAGLRIDKDCRVVDLSGKPIAGLWCGGESAGGSSQHGLGRCITQGYIIGQRVAALK